MTQYMISVIHDPNMDFEIDEATVAQMYAAVDAFNTGLKDNGQWVFGGGLEPANVAATVVDGTGAEVVMTDGPYLETKEQLGGFWVIEAADLDEALRLAAAGSKACQGKVEVRPFQGGTE